MTVSNVTLKGHH